MANRITTTEYHAQATARKVKRDYKAEFLNQLHLAGLPQPAYGKGCELPELVFAPPRRWRFDFCWPEYMVACEYNGIFGARNTSHASIAQLKRDYEKLTEASLLGYTIVLITAETVSDGRAVAWVERALRKRMGKTNG